MIDAAKGHSIHPSPLVADEFHRYERRRLKAAIALVSVWSFTAILHLAVWGQWLVYGLTICTGLHFFAVVLESAQTLARSAAQLARHHCHRTPNGRFNSVADGFDFSRGQK